MSALSYLAVCLGVFLLFIAVCSLLAFSIVSRSDDLKHPTSRRVHRVRHRAARRMAGAVIIKRD